MEFHSGACLFCVGYVGKKLVLYSHSCEFGINHDAAAVLADDYLHVHLDFHLFLWRDAVEAAAAGVTLNVYDAETVACVLADALEGSQSALVNLRLDSLGLVAQVIFLGTCLGDNLVEFGFLFLKDVARVFQTFLCGCDISLLVLDGAAIFVDVFFGELDLEVLEFDFLGK